MISRVVETIDGKIWIIASDEGHLDPSGYQRWRVDCLSGLARFFDAFGKNQAATEMITGYTQNRR